MTVYEAIMVMLGFGTFILAQITVTILLIRHHNKKK